MALSPLDIHNKEFNVRMRGYDQDQVNDFLSQIIKDYSALLKSNEEMQKQLADAQEKVKYFNDLKDALNQSIIVAQEAADKVKTNAEQEADLIQQQAEKNAQDLLTSSTEKANRIVGDASEKAKKITVETEDLKRQTRVFRQRLQVMLESQLEVVKSPEWKELLSSSDAAPDVLDPANMQTDLDKQPVQPVESEQTAVADDQSGYTEIIFPQEDDEAAPAASSDDTEE
ncbi:DivIVA domain-containing protein [Lacticaseibacillus baoqingensis]|uniref:DivIVA domain-containing protein n=1 Tax=Lacticaseibacillus baoqingensis TaxID=2486013 RepID=A0ABW4E412_9LACO|nr:DivIVA domain-containing protein [Lacticaseibacillus baoqingensis]